MDYTFADRLKNITSSATVSLAEKAKSLRDAGQDIIDLTIGEPDFPTPPHIIRAGYRAMIKGHTKYTNSRGIIELRKAIAQKLENENELLYSADTEIIVTPGGKQAILYAVLALINPGDEVLCIEPCWLGYESCIALAGGVYVGVETHEEDGFSITEKQILEKVTPRTKLMLINSPCNPTGKVLTKEELEIISKICIEKNMMCVSDDIYEKIIFDNHRFHSIASLPSMRERTLVLNGFSKAYSMTGWRLAYLAGDRKIIGQINKLQQLSATCPSAVSQWAGVEALTGLQLHLKKMTQAYEVRRNIVHKGFNNKKLACFKAQGAFYGFVNVKRLGMSSDQACEFLLEKAKMVTVPGSAFGKAGEGYVRISFGTSEKNLKKAIKNLEYL
ncbi:pyridoxal phosphate-dependent aminotransferase [bacterium]|nr:MAG: pyridoxal phosphate-dependent aminotransferase [bacterium]